MVVGDPRCRSGVLLQPARVLSTGEGSANTSACCTDSQTGVLQECLSLAVRSGLGVPLGPRAAPGWGRGEGRGGRCPCPCPVQQHLAAGRARRLGPPAPHVPAMHRGRRQSFPICVSCAAAEPCPGPAQRPVPALPCAAATSAPSLAGGELEGPPLLPAAPDAHRPGGQQPAVRKVVCPHRVNL